MRRRSFLAALAALPFAPRALARLAEEKDREAILLGALSDRFEVLGDQVVPGELVEYYSDSDGAINRVRLEASERLGGGLVEVGPDGRVRLFTGEVRDISGRIQA